MTLRLRTFGAVYLERDRAPLGGAHSQRRRLALLAYLAAAEGAAISREKLIALLWPESDEAGGRHSLSQLVYALRHDLGSDVLTIDSETVRLDPAALPSDVAEFGEALHGGELEEAVARYRGAFLDGFHVDDAPELSRWIEDERRRRAGACADALERLASAAERRGDRHRAVESWRRLVELDPTDGRATLRLMQCLAAIGDRAGAVRTSRIYESLVREDLEAEPDAEVVRLADELRHVPAPSEPPPTFQTRQADTPRVVTSAEPVSRAHSVEAQPPAPPFRRARLVLMFASGVAAVIVGAAYLRAELGRGAVPAAGAASVVIGDVVGPDSTLALAVREALRAQLVNTPGILVASDYGIGELKSLMRLPRDVVLVPPELLAVATRSGAHVAVTGSVVPVGSGAQIVVELLEPASGRPVRTFAERPADGEALLEAVERIGRALGDELSRAPRDSSVRPLPAVTTASLPALKSYAVARQIAASGHRMEAIGPGERAVAHDSAFVLAHYFLGDLLWFLDEQTHAEAHLTKAFDLRATVPLREQLIIRARYEQLVLDRPDTALVYWALLHDAAPGDPLAYEGRTWALRALGRYEEAAAAADTAMTLEPSALLPNLTNAMYARLAVHDTGGALAVARRVEDRMPEAIAEARFHAAYARGDLAGARSFAERSPHSSARAWRRHFVSLAQGDLVAARADLDSLRADERAQFLPNALIDHGRMELILRADSAAASRYAREALAWTRSRDLSPQAVGRLTERIADLAARAGDVAIVGEAAELIRERDRGRGLPTYALALRTMQAAQAYARGDAAEAARLAEQARGGVYFSRSMTTLVQLEADARRAAGDVRAADSLDRLVRHRQVADGHFEVAAFLGRVAADRAERR